MIKHFRLITIACMTFFMSNLACADDWFQVEVIAFEYVHPNADELEFWDRPAGEPDWKNGINLMDEATARSRYKKQQEEAAAAAPPPDAAHTHAEQPANTAAPGMVPVEQLLTGHTDPHPGSTASNNPTLAYVALPSSQYTLGDFVNKLNKRGSYKILTHTAWRQPAFGGNNSEAVHIFGGKLLDREGPEGARYEFEGLIALRSNRYLHLDVDAMLRENEGKDQGGKFNSPADLGLLENSSNSDHRTHIYQAYRMLQSQRVRSNKVYYFDHPMMGLIIKTSPYGG